MKNMATCLIAATAMAGLATAAPAQTFQPKSFNSRAHVFEVADMDDNNMLSREEYMQLRMNIVDENSVWSYRADARDKASAAFQRSFAAMDRDRNGWVSATEFANAPALPQQSADRSDWSSAPGWDPEYMTVTYYLMANEVDTDRVVDRPVMNLKGEQVGTLEKIIRTDDENRYYALIDLDTSGLTTPIRERSNAGIPLDDVLLFDDASQLMLSTRGEEYLKNADAKYLDDMDYETVDSLYRVS
jgi:hypothetical protein